jgi:hypothetical protein
MKRPKDMTQAEREALPVGPFAVHSRLVTAEDRRRGIMGRTIETPVARAVMVSRYEGDDILCFWDRQDRMWTFGQFADGAWFKQPA